MSNVLNALFDQEDDSEENANVETELVYDDGQDETVEDNASDEAIDDEVEVAETEESSEETGDEANAESGTETEDEALSPELEKVARAAEGRLGGMLAEREKRQQVQRELEEANNRIRAYEQQQAQYRAQNMPDPNSDPHGYADSIREQYEKQAVEQRFYYSDQMARTKHGAEKVEQAALWATAQIQANPHLQATMYAQPDPLNWVVEQFEQNQFETKLRTDPDSLFKEWAERNGYKPAGSTPAPVAQVRTPAAATQPKTAPKRAQAARIATPAKRGGSDAPSSVLGALGLDN